MKAGARFDDAFVRTALGLPGSQPITFSGVVSDTRILSPGALFVALKGDRYDGHDYLESARDRGATAAVVANGTPEVSGMCLYHVSDPLHAWGELARADRTRITGPVIAITGQNGKTSTREMVAAVIATRWKMWQTRGNNNNTVGVPLTILESPDATEALVIEAGANRPGEIARYREIIAPDIAIVTNAGAGHLEGFGSIAGVVREKLELTRSVARVVVGVQPPELAAGALVRGAARVSSAGLANADLTPDRVEVTADGRPGITIDGQTFLLAARGLHQAGNAMFAWALVRELGLDPEKAARALENLRIPGGRGELIQHESLTVLNDSYNANPESFTAAIAMAESLRDGRRLVFVAGTMKELGDASTGLHQVVARRLIALAPELLVLVGDFVAAFDAVSAGYGGMVIRAPDADAAGGQLVPELAGDELLVLKGSRGAALERILPAILSRHSTA